MTWLLVWFLDKAFGRSCGGLLGFMFGDGGGAAQAVQAFGARPLQPGERESRDEADRSELRRYHDICGTAKAAEVERKVGMSSPGGVHM